MTLALALKVISFFAVGLLDAAVLNAVYISVIRPRIRVFVAKGSPDDTQESERDTSVWHVTIQNFEERSLEGVFIIRLHSSRGDGLVPPTKILGFFGPAEISWKFSGGNELIVRSANFRPLKTWSFLIRRNVPDHGDRVWADVLYRPQSGLRYEIGRKFDSRYVQFNDELYFSWVSEDEVEAEDEHGQGQTQRTQMTPDWRTLALALSLALAAYATVVLIQEDGDLARLMPQGAVDYAAVLFAMAFVGLAFWLLRRPLFPVAQGYRISHDLSWPGSQEPGLAARPVVESATGPVVGSTPEPSTQAACAPSAPSQTPEPSETACSASRAPPAGSA